MKKYWHELQQEEIDSILNENKTVGFIVKNYKQPKWCGLHLALEGVLGCWSLMDLTSNGRTKISKEFCSACDYFKNQQPKMGFNKK